MVSSYVYGAYKPPAQYARDGHEHRCSKNFFLRLSSTSYLSFFAAARPRVNGVFSAHCQARPPAHAYV